MIRELLRLYRVFFKAYLPAVLGWGAIQCGLIIGLNVLLRSSGFISVRSQNSAPIAFWLGTEFIISILSTWVLAGFLGYTFNSTRRKNWLNQLPFSASSILLAPQLLLIANAFLIYLGLPYFWNTGSASHALPGTLMFVFFPFVVFYLVERAARPIAVFAPSVLIAPISYWAFMAIPNSRIIQWRIEHIWSPEFQGVFLLLVVAAALTFQVVRKRSRPKVLLALLGGLMVFQMLIIAVPPFSLMKNSLCKDVLTERPPGTYLYSEMELRSCHADRAP